MAESVEELQKRVSRWGWEKKSEIEAYLAVNPNALEKLPPEIRCRLMVGIFNSKGGYFEGQAFSPTDDINILIPLLLAHGSRWDDRQKAQDPASSLTAQLANNPRWIGFIDVEDWLNIVRTDTGLTLNTEVKTRLAQMDPGQYRNARQPLWQALAIKTIERHPIECEKDFHTLLQTVKQAGITPEGSGLEEWVYRWAKGLTERPAYTNDTLEKKWRGERFAVLMRAGIDMQNLLERNSKEDKILKNLQAHIRKTAQAAVGRLVEGKEQEGDFLTAVSGRELPQLAGKMLGTPRQEALVEKCTTELSPHYQRKYPHILATVARRGALEEKGSALGEWVRGGAA